jgi:hypothetical protein
MMKINEVAPSTHNVKTRVMASKHVMNAGRREYDDQIVTQTA